MLTVLFSTFNGAHTLPRALDALTRLREPAGGWQLVVVDNASTDATPDILSRYRSSLPLTVLHESNRGQNAARNVGLAACRGDLVVFTDDDVVADAEWLCQLRGAADEHPGVEVFGGRVLPLWEAEPPDWLLDGVPTAAAFALTRDGQVSGPARASDCYGPNFAVRTRCFDGGLRFRTDLGPRGRSYPMGGETELLWQLERAGAHVRFVDQAVVRHIVRPWQLHPAWLRRRAFNFGRGLCHVYRRSRPPSRAATIFGMPRWRLWQFPYRHLVPRGRAWLRGDRASRTAASWAMWCDAGWLFEERALSRAGLSAAPGPRPEGAPTTDSSPC